MQYAQSVISDFSRIKSEGPTGSVHASIQGYELRTFKDCSADAEAKNFIATYVMKNVGDIASHPFFRKTAREFTNAYVHIIEPSVSAAPSELKIENIDGVGNGYALIVVKPGANVSIVEKIASRSSLGMILDIVVCDNASLQYEIIEEGKDDTFSHALRTFHVHRQSNLHVNHVVVSSSDLLSHSYIHLHDDNAHATLKSMGKSQGSAMHDIHHSVRHLSENTYSDLLLKGICADESNMVYSSNIAVTAPAIRSTAKQKADVVVTSKKAKASAIPGLDIRQGAIQCSHGASVSQIDEMVLFYAKKRGLSDLDARKLALQAHVSPVQQALSDTLAPYVASHF